MNSQLELSTFDNLKVVKLPFRFYAPAQIDVKTFYHDVIDNARKRKQYWNKNGI